MTLNKQHLHRTGSHGPAIKLRRMVNVASAISKVETLLSEYKHIFGDIMMEAPLETQRVMQMIHYEHKLLIETLDDKLENITLSVH